MARRSQRDDAGRHGARLKERFLKLARLAADKGHEAESKSAAEAGVAGYGRRANVALFPLVRPPTGERRTR